MARFRKPFFKKSHGCWYVQLDGKQVRLDPDREAAFERYHELMRERKRAARVAPAPGAAEEISLAKLCEQFLTAGFAGKSAATREWYRQRLEPLVLYVGGELPAKLLAPAHVDAWVAKHAEWAAGTVRNLWRAVQRMCRWGHRRGYVPEMSVLHQEKPRGGKRDVVISPTEFATLLEWVRNSHFRAVLVVCWETAARPQELLRAEVRHLDRAGRRLVFQPEESKDKSVARVVYLTDAAFELLAAGADDRSADARLLVNSEGRPWTTDAVNCAFAALHKRMVKGGVKGVRKFCLYHLRHSWLDRKLKGGVDALTCAVLMGHKDPGQVARTYQHLSQSPDYLREVLNRESA